MDPKTEQEVVRGLLPFTVNGEPRNVPELKRGPNREWQAANEAAYAALGATPYDTPAGQRAMGDAQLELILALVRDLGVNLAGVEVVLNMRQKIELIEAGVNELLEFVKREFYSGREDEFERRRTGLVPVRPMKMVKVEKPVE